MIPLHFQIIAMLKRGYRYDQVAKEVAMPKKQLYLETQTLRRKWGVRTNRDLIQYFGGYL